MKFVDVMSITASMAAVAAIGSVTYWLSTTKIVDLSLPGAEAQETTPVNPTDGQAMTSMSGGGCANNQDGSARICEIVLGAPVWSDGYVPSTQTPLANGCIKWDVDTSRETIACPTATPSST